MKKLVTVVGMLLTSGIIYSQQLKKGTINRKEVVQRHNYHITDLQEPGPTQVGNGNFAYGFDATGMQTFNDSFTTMSQWSWHSSPLPAGFTAADFKQTNINIQGRMVPYDLPNPQQAALSSWLDANPHRFNLGRIGLWMKMENGTAVTAGDIQAADQYFDLWSAVAVSTFRIQGQPVQVTTVADPDKDIVAFKITSPLIAAKRLGVFIDFPYANLNVFSNGSDYNKPASHQTILVADKKSQVTFSRVMDSTQYEVKASWTGPNSITKEKPHRYKFMPAGSNEIEYVFSFAPWKIKQPLPSFAEVKAHAQKYWPSFWNSGGFIDLSHSKDSQWMELERRIILSQYIMRINAAGQYPPQETGLVNNSWYGRFHYEMILWHNAHNALWNRWSLLNNSLHVYQDNLMAAKQRAATQGYKGARFPKCTGPDGREWPHPIHAFLVWQQPHPVFFANLDYRAHPTTATLEKWMNIIDASADFLASYPSFDTASKHYVLGPPIAFAPENNQFYKDRNPAFELGYWRYALRTAQLLRQQAGLPGKPLWSKVYQQLSPIPLRDNFYEQWENIDSMWTKYNFEHPALLGIYGLLPGDGVDTTIMKNTFRKVLDTWKFDTGWGWDFPLMAMTAARLGETKEAIYMLLHASPKNGYDKHGFVGGGNPYPYIPTNGALLYAVAFMAAGWDGDQQLSTPGFPKDGSWTVMWEDLKKAP
ncbi:hypothetical protein GA0116948_108161 [Chitinophaga costaii]|uniref:Glycosyl hydrolase family 65, N-terminal domain n=1 Tax=Chitinophaga costaii TaxID=1335309 RepID=A0A1C4EJD9_9BACT|nr:hypothetical protein [Chitinophaga costaii]PUZ23781.1 hypothetical protein DCM91_13355 [Chitinophaga costaii]SCC43681.1 hypothetical protein GA0116948_108161 [Chitinophaga costaii]